MARFASKMYRISQEEVNRFAEASEGRGRIHTDPEYAESTPFGGTLVHGHFLFAMMEKELGEHIPGWNERGRLKATFVKPLKVGQAFQLVWERSEDNKLNLAIKSEGETLVVGEGELR